MTIWDIYFWYLKNRPIINWYDVETKIYELLSGKSEWGEIKPLESSSEELFEILIPDKLKSITNGYEKNENLFLKKERMTRLFLIIKIIMQTSSAYKREDSIYQNLLSQLLKFEENFREYLQEVKKSKAYQENTLFEKIRTEIGPDDYYILNFNYTSILERVKGRTDNIQEVNVHGRYDQLSIFGIDQKQVSAKNELFMFTKTYRKITNQEKIYSFALPKDKAHNEKSRIDDIVFYGHSLATADYSYFQSIFDYYKLYESDINLIFLYSLYGKKEDHYKILPEMVKRVTELLEEYGESMTNKDHGKNLLHKLLLENRLFILKI